MQRAYYVSIVLALVSFVIWALTAFSVIDDEASLEPIARSCFHAFSILMILLGHKLGKFNLTAPASPQGGTYVIIATGLAAVLFLVFAEVAGWIIILATSATGIVAFLAHQFWVRNKDEIGEARFDTSNSNHRVD